jgi:hypothetical protein
VEASFFLEHHTMSNPTAVSNAIGMFTTEAHGLLPLTSTKYKSYCGDIRQSARPLTTAKAILRRLRSQPAPAPVVVEAAPKMTQGEPTCVEGSAEPLTIKQALAEPDVFSQAGVTVIECAIARQRHWIDPSERRVIAKMRKAVARGDRAAWDRAIAALDYQGTNPVQSTAWRKAEREFEAEEVTAS